MKNHGEFAVCVPPKRNKSSAIIVGLRARVRPRIDDIQRRALGRSYAQSAESSPRTCASISACAARGAHLEKYRLPQKRICVKYKAVRIQR